MPKRCSDHKMRILAVENIICRCNPITTQQIIDRLSKEYCIDAERKTIYSDIAVLTRFHNIQPTGHSFYNKWVIIND